MGAKAQHNRYTFHFHVALAPIGLIQSQYLNIYFPETCYNHIQIVELALHFLISLLGNEALIRQFVYDYSKFQGNKYSDIDFGLSQWGLKQRENETYIDYVVL